MDATTGSISTTDKGQLGATNSWDDLIDKAHKRHPDLTRAQVESTITSMRKRASQSNKPVIIPTDGEADQEHTTGETQATNQATQFTPSDEEISEEMLFDEEGVNVIITPFRTSQQFQSKAASSKSAFDFGSSSSTPETESTPKLKDDATIKLGPSTQHADQEHDHSGDSTGSSACNHIDPFALVEIQNNISLTMQTVNTIEASVSGLNNKLEEKVSGLDSILDFILSSINKQSEPSTTEREAQLDQLISLRLNYTIEKVEHKYDTSVDHYMETITNMLKVHDDLVAATNDLIKKTHVRHEKQIQ